MEAVVPASVEPPLPLGSLFDEHNRADTKSEGPPIQDFVQHPSGINANQFSRVNTQEIVSQPTVDGPTREATRSDNRQPLLQSHLSSRSCNREEIDKPVPSQQNDMLVLGNHHPQSPTQLAELGKSMLQRAEGAENISDVKLAISFFNQALSLTPAGHPERHDVLKCLGYSYERHFQISRDVDNVDQAILIHRQSIFLTTDGTREMASLLRNLSILHNSRFECLGGLADIEQAIDLQTRALTIKRSIGEEEHIELTELVGYLFSRFKKLSHSSDIERAASYCEQIISVTPSQHPDLHMYHHNFSMVSEAQFESSSNYPDLDRAIVSCRNALALIPQNHTDQNWYRSRLVDLLQTRIRYSSQPQDLDEAILTCGCILEAHSNNASTRGMKHLVQLGYLLTFRFSYSATRNDIDRSIGVFEQVLAPYFDGSAAGDETGDLLLKLGIALTYRYEHFGQRPDIDRAISCHEHAVNLAPPDDASMPIRLSELGSSFKARFQLTGQLDDVNNAIDCLLQAINLESGTAPGGITRRQLLAVSLVIRFEATKNTTDLDQAIELYRQTISWLEDGYLDKAMLLNGLGNALNLRFGYVENTTDIDEAIGFHIQSILLTPESHSRWVSRRVNAGAALLARYRHLRQFQDLNKAIEYLEQGLANTPDGHAVKRIIYSALGHGLLCRFHHSQSLEDITQAANCYKITLDLAAGDRMIQLGAFTGLAQVLAARFDLLQEMSDIDRAIEYSMHALQSLPEHHSQSTIQYHLSGMYASRFRQSQHLADIDQGIVHAISALRSTQASNLDSSKLLRCGTIFLSRSIHTKDLENRSSAIACFKQVAELSTGSLSDRFLAACKWASLAQSQNLEAYQLAINLLLRLLWIGVSVQTRYKIISSSEGVVVEAAAAAIKFGKLDLALEWLEAGRSVIWQQHLNLRRPLDELREVNSALADRLETVARHLDRVEVPQFSDLDMDNPQSSERLSQQHRQYANEWQRLIEEVRAIPTLSDFLQPTKASCLVQTARSGPVIVINVAKTSCDALVVVPGGKGVGHVPLPEFSADDASQAYSQLTGLLHTHGLTTRGIRRDATKSKGVYTNILALLWNAVVKPILDYLGLVAPMPMYERPHITWCTTGPLGFLPLHAAGLYGEPGERLFNYAISSYAPTLSALPRAQQAEDEFNGVLAVSQTHTTGEAYFPGAIAELTQLKKHTHGMRFTQLEETEASADRVLSSMHSHSWVHLACHAVQNPVEPTKSAFLLHRGTLSLATIMGQPISKGGLAYLSACQTATGDANMSDESVHLAAGMLMAGYSSVIATMWSIMDLDAPVVAAGVYSELICRGVADRTRAAKALHIAVAKLREKIGEENYERWVPFIHIGA